MWFALNALSQNVRNVHVAIEPGILLLYLALQQDVQRIRGSPCNSVTILSWDGVEN